MKRTLLLLLLFLPLTAYEILGVGTVCIDHIIRVEDGFLLSIPVDKGGWASLSYKEFKEVMGRANAQGAPMISTGGCTPNTIKGLASLGLSCALVSKLGEGQMGHFAEQALWNAGVRPIFSYTKTPTSQIACLITPDGERSFCAFVEAEREFSSEDLREADFGPARLVHIDGYLLENGDCIEQIIAMAKRNGCLVSFDLASPPAVQKARKRLLEEIIPNGVDILFANEREAKTLTHLGAQDAATLLAELCTIAIVKVGEKGCYVGTKERVYYSPGIPTHAVDSTGAGDLFAAGFLHKYLQDFPLQDCADFANRVGSTVIETAGAQIPESKWKELRLM